MEHMKESIGITYKELIPRMAGFFISFMLTAVVLATTYKSGLHFASNIQMIAVFIFGFWGILLVRTRGIKPYSFLQLLFFCIMIVILALYLTYWVWHCGYLTNIPVAAINKQENGLNYDSLFHVSIAQGIKYYGVPSFLVNSDSFFNYHFGSHLVMAVISICSGIPVFFAYCYIYPIIFLPLFVYLSLSVIQEFRYYKNNSETITILDFFVFMCFLMPVLVPKNISDMLADWKTSWFVSESYLVAAVVTLLFLKALLCAHRNGCLKSKPAKNVFMIIIMPFVIVISSLAKISFGFFLCMGIVYYLFRNHTKEIRYWLIEVYYMLCFAFVFLFPSRFYSAFVSNTGFSSIALLNHVKKYIGMNLLGFHIIIYYFFAIIVLAFQLRREKSLLKIIKNKEYVFEEILFWICLVGAIPGNLFIIRGGSSFYFSSVQQLAAVILLLGFNIPNRVFRKLRMKLTCFTKALLILMLFCISCDPLLKSVDYMLTIISDCKTGAMLQRAACSENGSYWDIICRITDYSGDNVADYYIYVGESANVWQRFEHRDEAIHFYPAMTGIVSIGELYYEDGRMYYNDGTEYRSGWYKPNPNETKLTLERAIEKASIDGKKALIYLYENNMEVIPVNQ